MFSSSSSSPTPSHFLDVFTHQLHRFRYLTILLSLSIIGVSIALAWIIHPNYQDEMNMKDISVEAAWNSYGATSVLLPSSSPATSNILISIRSSSPLTNTTLTSLTSSISSICYNYGDTTTSPFLSLSSAPNNTIWLPSTHIANDSMSAVMIVTVSALHANVDAFRAYLSQQLTTLNTGVLIDTTSSQQLQHASILATRDSIISTLIITLPITCFLTFLLLRSIRLTLLYIYILIVTILGVTLLMYPIARYAMDFDWVTMWMIYAVTGVGIMVQSTIMIASWIDGCRTWPHHDIHQHVAVLLSITGAPLLMTNFIMICVSCILVAHSTPLFRTSGITIIASAFCISCSLAILLPTLFLTFTHPFVDAVSLPVDEDEHTPLCELFLHFIRAKCLRKRARSEHKRSVFEGYELELPTIDPDLLVQQQQEALRALQKRESFTPSLRSHTHNRDIIVLPTTLATLPIIPDSARKHTDSPVQPMMVTVEPASSKHTSAAPSVASTPHATPKVSNADALTIPVASAAAAADPTVRHPSGVYEQNPLFDGGDFNTTTASLAPIANPTLSTGLVQVHASPSLNVRLTSRPALDPAHHRHTTGMTDVGGIVIVGDGDSPDSDVPASADPPAAATVPVAAPEAIDLDITQTVSFATDPAYPIFRNGSLEAKQHERQQEAIQEEERKERMRTLEGEMKQVEEIKVQEEKRQEEAQKQAAAMKMEEEKKRHQEKKQQDEYKHAHEMEIDVEVDGESRDAWQELSVVGVDAGTRAKGHTTLHLNNDIPLDGSSSPTDSSPTPSRRHSTSSRRRSISSTRGRHRSSGPPVAVIEKIDDLDVGEADEDDVAHQLADLGGVSHPCTIETLFREQSRSWGYRWASLITSHIAVSLILCAIIIGGQLFIILWQTPHITWTMDTRITTARDTTVYTTYQSLLTTMTSVNTPLVSGIDPYVITVSGANADTPTHYNATKSFITYLLKGGGSVASAIERGWITSSSVVAISYVDGVYRTQTRHIDETPADVEAYKRRIYSQLVSSDGASSQILIHTQFEPSDTAQVFLSYLDQVIAASSTSSPGITFTVSSTASHLIHQQYRYTSAYTLIIIITISVIVACVLLFTQSPYLTIQFVGTWMMSVTCIYGCAVWIFQEGKWGDVFPSWPNPTHLHWLIPIMATPLHLLLSLSYDMTFIHRVHHMQRVRYDARSSIQKSMLQMGRVHTCITISMVIVLGAGIFIKTMLMSQLAILLALWLLLDVITIRMIVTPCLLYLIPISIQWWPHKSPTSIHDTSCFIERPHLHRTMSEDEKVVASSNADNVGDGNVDEEFHPQEELPVLVNGVSSSPTQSAAVATPMSITPIKPAQSLHLPNQPSHSAQTHDSSHPSRPSVDINAVYDSLAHQSDPLQPVDITSSSQVPSPRTSPPISPRLMMPRHSGVIAVTTYNNFLHTK